MLSLATFPLNVRIIRLDNFSDQFSSYVACVCNHCCQTNQMVLTSHLSCVYDDFSSYCVYFSLMASLTMMGLVPAHLVRALIHFIVSVAKDLKW